MSDKRKLVILCVIGAVLAVLMLGLGLNSFIFRYALSRRIPRLAAIVLTGCAVAASTVVFQTITHNRILTPSIMGLDSLYLFIQTSTVFVLGSQSQFMTNTVLNFVVSGGLMIGGTLLLFRFLLRSDEGANLFQLLLVGVIMGTLFDSGASFMQMVIDPNEFQAVQNRMFASFNNIQTNVLVPAAAILVVTLIYIIRQAHILDVLALGREHAVNLGVPYDKVTVKLLAAVSVLVATSTALVGPVTFLGLLIANLAREMLSGYEHRWLLPTAGLLGVIALIGGQLAAAHLFNLSAPISVIINFIGGIYFISLLLRARTAD